MPDTLDLEITLSHSEPDGYQAELRFSDLLGAARRPIKTPIYLDLESLRKNQPDSDSSRVLLAAALFNEPLLRDGLQAAIAAALPDRLLRLHLMVDPSAPELQFLSHEVLLDPRNNQHFEYLPAEERLRIASEQVEQQRGVNRRLRLWLALLTIVCVAALAAVALVVLNNRGLVPNLGPAGQAQAAAFAEQTRVAQALGTATAVLNAAEIANQAALDQQSTLADTP